MLRIALPTGSLARCKANFRGACRIAKSSDAINGDSHGIACSVSQGHQISVIGIGKEGSDRCSAGKAKQHEPVRFPVSFDDLEVTSPNKVFAAMLRD
jgi:hypothetical protein